MWFFKSPEFYFGEGALRYLNQLRGERAFIVTDENIQGLGFVEPIQKQLAENGISSQVFAAVEPDPSLDTVQRGAKVVQAYEPDWIISLGGGSCIDAAKGMWVLYECPDLELEFINPVADIGLGQKARLIAIPTTAGSGSESGYGMVLTDTEEKRKLTLANREIMASVVIVDPSLTAKLPRQITADSGIDVLSHAIEGYSCTFANDFNNGLCLQAAKLVFQYLPRAVTHGNNDEEAREKMANAASIAGLSLGNSTVALGHTLGHSAGAYFRTLPHGRITAIFMPFTIEFTSLSGNSRYQGMAQTLGLQASDERKAAFALASAMRDLMRRIDLPLSLRDAGISPDEFEAALLSIVEHADSDPNIIQSRRIPDTEEIEMLLRYAYEGKSIDF
jgi:alcohol dehydrogenase class IV